MRSLVSENKVIAALNDSLRRFHTGGMVVISRGIAALPREVWAEVIVAVAEFTAFTPHNDLQDRLFRSEHALPLR